MKIEDINRYSPLAVGLKLSAIQDKALLRGPERLFKDHKPSAM
jgi:hypothetical protein